MPPGNLSDIISCKQKKLAHLLGKYGRGEREVLNNSARKQKILKEAGDLFVHQEKGFTVHVRLDRGNELLWVVDYEVSASKNFYNYLWELARHLNVGKIIFPVRPYDLYLLKNEWFVMEGYLDGFFAGVPGCFLAGFRNPGRALSSSLAEEQRALTRILISRRTRQTFLPPGIKITQATENDAATLNLILKTNPARIVSALRKGDVYLVARQAEKITGVVAAERDLKYKRAEITRYAILPEYQNSHLSNVLFRALGEKCRSLGIHCLYSLVKASAYELNLALHNSGFLFRGTLVNNCSVAERFENLHIWVLP